MILGIDPGASGGIAWHDKEMQAVKMPDTEADLWSAIKLVRASKFAVLEKVGPMPGQGVTSMFNFGGSYFALRMALVAAEIPFELVTPQTWQKHFGLIRANKSESLTDKKNRHKGKAQQLFPHLKITHKIADAVLIAEYARRTFG